MIFLLSPFHFFRGVRRSALVEKQCEENTELLGDEREGRVIRGGIDLNRGEEEYRGSNDYGDDVVWGEEPDHDDVWDTDTGSDGDDHDNYIHRDSSSSDSDSEDVDMIDNNNNNVSIGL